MIDSCPYTFKVVRASLWKTLQGKECSHHSHQLIAAVHDKVCGYIRQGVNRLTSINRRVGIHGSWHEKQSQDAIEEAKLASYKAKRTLIILKFTYKGHQLNGLVVCRLARVLTASAAHAAPHAAQM